MLAYSFEEEGPGVINLYCQTLMEGGRGGFKAPGLT
jgi:hypothetical protein